MGPPGGAFHWSDRVGNLVNMPFPTLLASWIAAQKPSPVFERSAAIKIAAAKTGDLVILCATAKSAAR